MKMDTTMATEVFIKYNPYKLETEIRINNEPLSKDGNSVLLDKIVPGTRLQDWVEELPQILVDEYNENEFIITFHGTQLDYEDLNEVLEKAKRDEILSEKCQLIPISAKETTDKEVQIEELFQKIQEGPFEELREKSVVSAFEKAKNSDFELCVVATMSSGKSTLINAMLGNKMMPSASEACTAIITHIKDVTTEPNAPWKAKVYKDGEFLTASDNMDYDEMVHINELAKPEKDEKGNPLPNSFFEIFMEGNIPFVTSDDVSLVLIDTPGPNNSRNLDHLKVQQKFLNESSKSLVLYIMTPTFGSDDDNALLDRVAKSMEVGGKQSKDRFIFVVNKWDDRKKEDGSTEASLERVRNYLKEHGIERPNLFPASALPAMSIRMMKNDLEEDEETIDETETKVKKMNRNSEQHLENYASLPNSLKEKIRSQLKETDNLLDYDNALIHTGVPSIEAAIRQYVQKYAKTAKIRNIVDSFNQKLEEVNSFEKTKQEIASNQEEANKIVQQIEEIRSKINDLNSAKKFEEAVESAVSAVIANSKKVSGSILGEFQSIVGETISEYYGEIELDEVDTLVRKLESEAKRLEPQFRSKLEENIELTLTQTANALLEEYRNKLRALSVEMGGSLNIKIDALSLVQGSMPSADSFSTSSLSQQTRKVENGEEWVENTDKKWYKPWTWFQEKGYYRTKYKNVTYVESNEVAATFFTPIQQLMEDERHSANKQAEKRARKIAEDFKKEFKRLDSVVQQKMNELEDCATDKTIAERRIKESENKLKWLENIKSEMEKILEI